MKKQNNSKLIKAYENSQFTTELWWNDETKQFDVWRNKKVVKTFSYKGYVLFEDMVNVAKIECDEWVNDTEHANMTLNEYLQRNNIKLTEKEIDTLECILSEGSFYEEGAPYARNENGDLDFDRPLVDRQYGTFLGWYIDEDEVPGCRGALSSLQKKGIITVQYDDSFMEGPQAAYYIYFALEFDESEGHYYHQLVINEENRK